ncbi:MAG: tetratricopeptide repeat protein, partial [Symploca sp. SIO2E6]|nr:tetratricopeptide repeat protein [Symploca sp. SIO2E6]
WEAASLNNLGNAYRNLGESSKALDFYQQSLAIKQEIGDRQGVANSLGSLGNFHFSQGNYDEAINSYQQSLAIFKKIGNRQGELASLTSLANAYSSQGNYGEAIGSYQQSLAIAQKTGNLRVELASLVGLGNAYTSQGNYDEAINSYQQSLAIAQKAGDLQVEATSLNNLGIAYLNMGNYSRAIDFQQQSLTIAQKISDQQSQAKALNNLGIVYDNLGNYNRAIDFYQQSLEIDKKIGDRQGIAASLDNLGTAYFSLKDYSLAIDFHQQSLAIKLNIGDRRGAAGSLGNLGNAYQGLGNYSRAIDFHQQSLAIAKVLEDRQGEADSLLNLGNAYYSQREYSRAIDFYEKSLAIKQEIGDLSGKGNSLTTLGAALKDSGKFAEAEKVLREGIETWEGIRELLGSQDDWKVSIFDEQATTYRLIQEVLISQNKPQEALEFAERGRARALVEILLRRRLRIPEELLTPDPPSLKEIQQIAQQQNATLVEYSLTPKQLYIWAVQPNGSVEFRSVDLPQETSFPELIQLSRKSIGVGGRGNNTSTPSKRNSTTHLQQLYQLLIEPIADLLPTDEEERIIFVPHRELFAVPFPALMDAQEQYLIEKHTILTAPSIQSLSFTHQRKQQLKNSSPPKGREVLIVGNPQMPKRGVGSNLKPLKPLPGAEKEAQAISPLFETNPIIGSNATETAIVERMSNARVIHLATHGLLDDINGIGTPGAIVLAPSKNKDESLLQEEDGFLTTYEIMQRFGQPESTPLQAELVVLSACDTGSGNIKGEGVIGLSRSLIAAGVPTIVVSLWQVPDDDTNLLMTEFYTNLYEKKLDKAQAMRRAMLTMLKEDRGNFNPIAWAAFTVIGEAE